MLFAFLSWYYLGIAAGAEKSIYARYGGFTNFLLTGLVANTILKSSLNSFLRATDFLVRGKVGGRTGQAMAFYDYCILMGIPLSVPILAWIIDEYVEGIIFAMIYLFIGWTFGYTYPVSRILISIFAIVLGGIALMSYSLLASAFALHFNTWRGGINPLVWALNILSNVFAGVYFPVEVIPSNLRLLSLILPQTYALRIIRSDFLNESTICDLMLLSIIITLLLPTGIILYRRELENLRRHPPIV